MGSFMFLGYTGPASGKDMPYDDKVFKGRAMRLQNVPLYLLCDLREA